MPITLRPSQSRGHVSHGWLDTYHTFSFGDYYDPSQMGYRTLRVINDDTIAGGEGFPTHGHRDMEIITYVTRGALAHKDSTGGEGVIRRGDVQTMSAGSGVQHSEFNALKDKDTHLYQIWITPEKKGIAPAYAQANFTDDDKLNNLRLLVAPKNTGSGLTINQNAYLYASIVDAGTSVSHTLKSGRGAWLQMVSGHVDINGTAMQTGDGAAIEDVGDVKVTAQKDSEFLLFDLSA